MSELAIISLVESVFDRYRVSQTIILDDLLLVENLLLLNKEMKKKLIAANFDGKLSTILQNSRHDNKQEWFIQAKHVLEILQEDTSKVKSIQDTPIIEDKNSKEGQIRKGTRSPFVSIMPSTFPVDMYQLLVRGYDVKLFTDDGSSRWMHLFVANDLSDIRCKRPNENFIKPKWIIKVHHIRVISAGYDKTSPIRNSGEFYFKKLPRQDLCFGLFGEHSVDGQKNFHILVDSSLMARRLFEGLQYLLATYKQSLMESLKRDSVG